MKDDSPVAWVIMEVGNSSGMTKKTAPNAPGAPTMPSIADTTHSVLRAGIYALLCSFCIVQQRYSGKHPEQ